MNRSRGRSTFHHGSSRALRAALALFTLAALALTPAVASARHGAALHRRHVVRTLRLRVNTGDALVAVQGQRPAQSNHLARGTRATSTRAQLARNGR